MYVLTWIVDGESAEAAYVSDSVENLKACAKVQWLRDCATDWPDDNMEDRLEQHIEPRDGTITFRYNDPISKEEGVLFAQIEKVEII